MSSKSLSDSDELLSDSSESPPDSDESASLPRLFAAAEAGESLSDSGEVGGEKLLGKVPILR